jgi:hypothetical protein
VVRLKPDTTEMAPAEMALAAGLDLDSVRLWPDRAVSVAAGTLG